MHPTLLFSVAQTAVAFAGSTLRNLRGARMNRILLAIVLLCTSCGDLKGEIQAGLDFGQDHTLQECVSESLRRLEGCESSRCQALSSGFARGCSEVASMKDPFCARVPNSLMKAVVWMKTECDASSNVKACVKVLQQPVKMCLQNDAA